MIEVRHQPLKEILIYDANKLDLKSLILNRIKQQSIPPLLWCDGIAFFFEVAYDNATMDENLAKGTLVWSRVFYAEMDEYKPMLEMDTPQFGGVKITVLDMGQFEIYKGFAKWAKAKR